MSSSVSSSRPGGVSGGVSHGASASSSFALPGGNCSQAQAHVRACRTCAKAKSRCQPPSDYQGREGPAGAKCRRCHRLNKECSLVHSSPQLARRHPPTAAAAAASHQPRGSRLHSTNSLSSSAASVSSSLLSSSSRAVAPQQQIQQPTAEDRARVTRLEERLDSIVSFLASRQGAAWNGPTLSSVASPSGESPGSIPSASFAHGRNATTAVGGGPRGSIGAQSGSTSSWAASFPTENGTGRGGRSSNNTSVMSPQSLVASWAAANPRKLFWYELPPEDGEVLLARYREALAWQFPFIVVPEDVTVDELVDKRPFLWRAIVATASYPDRRRQVAFGKHIMEDFSRSLLSNGENTLDLLQGLLIYIAWYHYYLTINPQITRLLSLAKALVVSLKLERSPSSIDRRRLLLDGIADNNSTSAPLGAGGSAPQYPATAAAAAASPNHQLLEEQRTLAGAFYLTSVVSASCRKLEPLRHTAYIATSSQALAKGRLAPGDCLIAPLVRLQQLAQSIHQALQAYDDGGSSIAGRAPARLHISMLQTELAAFWHGLGQSERRFPPLARNYDAATAMLYEIALLQPAQQQQQPRSPSPPTSATTVSAAAAPASSNSSHSSSSSSSSSSPLEKIHRLDALHRLLHAVSSFFTHFLNDENSTTLAPPPPPPSSSSLSHTATGRGSSNSTIAKTPGAQLVAASFVAWTQLGAMLLLALRLCFFDSAVADCGWDLAHAREYLHLGAVLDRLVARVDEAAAVRRPARRRDLHRDNDYDDYDDQDDHNSDFNDHGHGHGQDREGGDDDDDDVFSRFGSKMAQVRDWYVAKCQRSTAASSALLPSHAAPSSSFPSASSSSMTAAPATAPSWSQPSARSGIFANADNGLRDSGVGVNAENTDADTDARMDEGLWEELYSSLDSGGWMDCSVGGLGLMV